jgi:hypothetical protein
VGVQSASFGAARTQGGPLASGHSHGLIRNRTVNFRLRFSCLLGEIARNVHRLAMISRNPVNGPNFRQPGPYESGVACGKRDRHRSGCDTSRGW